MTRQQSYLAWVKVVTAMAHSPICDYCGRMLPATPVAVELPQGRKEYCSDACLDEDAVNRWEKEWQREL
jgi:hypothetical protein